MKANNLFHILLVISLVPDGEVTDAIFKMLLENLKETEELEERIEVIDPTVATLMRHLPEYAEAEMKNVKNLFDFL